MSIGSKEVIELKVGKPFKAPGVSFELLRPIKGKPGMWRVKQTKHGMLNHPGVNVVEMSADRIRALIEDDLGRCAVRGLSTSDARYIEPAPRRPRPRNPAPFRFANRFVGHATA